MRIFIFLSFIFQFETFIYSQPVITTIFGNGTAPGFAGDGTSASSALVKFNDPSSIVMDGYGDIYIADSYNYCVREVSGRTGIIYTIVGLINSGTPESISQYAKSMGSDLPSYVSSYPSGGIAATSAPLELPLGLALDPTGHYLYIADEKANVIWMMDLGYSYLFKFAGNASNFGAWWDQAFLSTYEGAAATNVSLCNPSGVAVDLSGNVFVADQWANLVLVVPSSSGEPPIYGKSCPVSNDIYRIAGDGYEGPGKKVLGGFYGDGGPALSAELCLPRSLAIDYSTGNLFISDTRNNVIRMVNTAGTISTVAGEYIQDLPIKYSSGGYSGDGGPATSAELYSPAGLAFDGSGNLYIADEANLCIREVNSGIITTVAGNKTGSLAAYASQQYPYSGDGGLPSLAELAFPTSMVIDGSGNMYIADFYNSAIRYVTP